MNDVINQFLSENYECIKPKWADTLSELSSHDDNTSLIALTPLHHLVFPKQDISRGSLKALRKQLMGGNLIANLPVTGKMISAGYNMERMIQILNSATKPVNCKEAFTLRVADIKFLLKHYTDKKVVQLIFNTSIEFFSDTMRMVARIIEAHPNIGFMPKKPKSIEVIHQACVRTLPKIHQGDFELNQREDVMLFDKTRLDETLSIRVPKTHFDLVDLGEALGFCIGDTAYSRGVKDRRYSIVAVFEGSKPLYGIQFSRYRILEAQGFGNEPHNKPTRTVLNLLQDKILETPTLPTDFLPITDSGWVNGYRYDNKDLYLLLQETVYVYFNVPQHVYEELLDSEVKGRFLNTQIKPQYECEKMGMLS
jgi:hypothetical protein